jgi:hypothetical protein
MAVFNRLYMFTVERVVQQIVCKFSLGETSVPFHWGMNLSGIPQKEGGRYATKGIKGVWPKLEAEGA